MGCGMSTEEKEGKARNEEIENQLKRDKMMQRNEIKMLLLGMYPGLLSAVAIWDRPVHPHWSPSQLSRPDSLTDESQALVNPASRPS